MWVCPVWSSSRTKSVKVPPTSIPRRIGYPFRRKKASLSEQTRLAELPEDRFQDVGDLTEGGVGADGVHHRRHHVRTLAGDVPQSLQSGRGRPGVARGDHLGRTADGGLRLLGAIRVQLDLARFLVHAVAVHADLGDGAVLQ